MNGREIVDGVGSVTVHSAVWVLDKGIGFRDSMKRAIVEADDRELWM
jgi:hypothetical protein